MTIQNILKDNWWKSATNQEMRTALMHLEMEAMDRLNNKVNAEYRIVREKCFEDCAEDNGWNDKKGET